jgi:uncharacterized membrane protein YqhA
VLAVDVILISNVIYLVEFICSEMFISHCKILVKGMEGGDYLGDLDTDGRIKLNFVFKK